MRSLVLAHKHEGLVGVTFLLEPLEAEVGDDIGCVADALDFLSIPFHPWVVIGTLAVQNLITIESGWVGLEVPLSDQGGLVSNLAQKLREGDLRAVEDASVGHLSVVEGVLAPRGSPPGTGRRSNWSRSSALESHAFLCDPVQVGGLDQFRPVGADGMRGMVIREDEQNIGLLGGSFHLRANPLSKSRRQDFFATSCKPSSLGIYENIQLLGSTESGLG